jgi:hypothetical protein
MEALLIAVGALVVGACVLAGIRSVVTGKKSNRSVVTLN